MKQGLGSEHPLCDRIQLLIIVLFFVAWGVDTVCLFIFGYSTVVFEAVSFPWLLAGTAVALGVSFYLVSKSHKAVLEQVRDPLVLVDSGVYAWVRHPMYLGTMLFCLALIFVSASLVSIVVLIGFFVFYDRMATYEEKSLIEILGERYVDYKKRVSKWIPGLC